MSHCGLRPCVLFLVLGAGIAAWAQQPLGLDTSFRLPALYNNVNSLYELEDGDLLLSGTMRFESETGAPADRYLARVDRNGVPRPDFPYLPGGGRLTPWEDRFYVIGGPGISRVWPTGEMDWSYYNSVSDLHQIGNTGDYYVYPDGSMMFSGQVFLFDTVRDFVGWHCLVWFDEHGELDTTKTHRRCGSMNRFCELPDGRFIGSGFTNDFEGEQTSNIIRFHPDGEFDPTFQAGVWWGEAFDFLPLEDGRVYATGLFRIEGISDTLHVVRFMPDGSLDPTFNNFLKFHKGALLAPFGSIVTDIFQLKPDRFIVSGNFQWAEGEFHGGLCMIDSSGYLAPEFEALGCDTFSHPYPPYTVGYPAGIVPSADGGYFLFGGYKGYDDGTINDPQQALVSRLYGLDVGLDERSAGTDRAAVWPNPAHDRIRFEVQGYEGNLDATLWDVQGRPVRSVPQHRSGELLAVGDLPPGLYTVRLETRHGKTYHLKWIKE